MSSHLPAEGFPQDSNPSGHAISTPQRSFITPDFRTKIVEILSRTANGCLHELGYRPGMPHQIVELHNRVSSLQDDNKKFYKDNQRLLQMVGDLRERKATTESFYKGTINSLERQIVSLHREIQDVLVREESLAAGNPDYSRLQADNMRLHGYCLQLKLQVGTLQKMWMENPSLQPPQVMISNHHQNAVVAGAQPIAGNLPKQPSVQAARRQTQPQQQQQRLIPSSHDNKHSGQPPQSQGLVYNQGRPQSSTSIVPAPSATQNNLGSQPVASSSVQTFAQANQILLNHKTSVASISRPSSSSSRHSNDMTNVDAHGFRLPGYKPALHGWPSGTSNPTVITNHPPQINPPRRLASAPSALSGGNPKVAPSPTTMSTTDGVTTGLLHHPNAKRAMNIPFVNPAMGTNFVPIGPPGKFLPPLQASVTKSEFSSMASNRPPPAQIQLIPAKVAKPPPPLPVIDLTNSSPIEPPTPVIASHPDSQDQPPTPMEANENMQTPNLTPTSSRASAAPSEDVPETMTPLDTPINHTIGLVESPSTIMMEDLGRDFSSETASPLKRSSMHMADGFDEDVMSGAEGMRKKARLSDEAEASPKPSDSITTAEPLDQAVVVDTDTSKTADAEMTGEGDDEDEDVEEEEEIGPDGTRSVKFCLEAFTDDGDDGVPTCLLCFSRFKNGLIEAPARFPPDMPQEEKVQHFLDEHPTSWEDFRYARNG